MKLHIHSNLTEKRAAVEQDNCARCPPATALCSFSAPDAATRNAVEECGVAVSSASGNEFAYSIEFITQAWPHLPPHVREAILTLIDASLITLSAEGVRDGE